MVSKNATSFSTEAQIKHTTAVMHKQPQWHSSARLLIMHSCAAAQEWLGANMTSFLTYSNF